MTKQKMEDLQSAGVDPLLLKEQAGGLIGVLYTMMASKHDSPNPETRNHVSRMYPACIPHVSRMYPACIQHVS